MAPRDSARGPRHGERAGGERPKLEPTQPFPLWTAGVGWVLLSLSRETGPGACTWAGPSPGSIDVSLVLPEKLRRGSMAGLWKAGASFLQRQFGRSPGSSPLEVPAADVTHQSWRQDSTAAGVRPGGAELKVTRLCPASQAAGGAVPHPDLSPLNPCSLTGSRPPTPQPPETRYLFECVS